MNYCVDANVFIAAWHTDYPIEIFPKLYREMEIKLTNNIILIKPILDEIEPTSGKKSAEQLRNEHPVRTWLQKNMEISKTPISDSCKKRALDLMNKYETDGHSKGASEADINLIAYASFSDARTVVTLESKQVQEPSKKSNYKIPLICKKEDIKCINFVEMLRQCGVKV